MEGDNSNNHINIIVIIKLISHVHTMTTPPLWERVFNLTSEDLNLGLECWAGSWVSWGALANILLFLSFFLISGERENEERLFCHYINFLFDSRTLVLSLSYLGDRPRHAAGAEVQLAREAAVAVVARVGEGGAQLNTVQIRVLQFWNNNFSATIFTDKHF